MGGGDLNMKKHFHPLTRENLERVWKAEQQQAEELKRIEERKKEIAEERSKMELVDHAANYGIIAKKEERLEWMYCGNRVNTEEYLLGKEVDSEVLHNPSQPNKEAERGNFSNNKRGNRNANKLPANLVDMARKIKEDPLFLIKKRELAATKNIVANSSRVVQIMEQSTRRLNSIKNANDNHRDRDYESSRSSMRSSRAPSSTPVHLAGWETPRISQSRYNRHSTSPEHKINDWHRSERSNQKSNRNEHRSRSPPPSRRRTESRRETPSQQDSEAKLKRMMENAKVRKEKLSKKVESITKEEELDRKLQEKLLKMKTGPSKAFSSQHGDVKMGAWSSQRYIK